MPAMQGRARFKWQAEPKGARVSRKLHSLHFRTSRAHARILPAEPAAAPNPQPPQPLAPPQLQVREDSENLLEGFCPEPSQEEQIAVKTNGLMLSLRLAEIEWLEATDACVKLHVGKQTHRLRDTFAAVAAKLPPGRFLRISRSTLVNVEHIQAVQRLFFNEYEVLLRNGTRLRLARAYCENLRQIGMSLPAPIPLILSIRLVIEGPTGN